MTESETRAARPLCSDLRSKRWFFLKAPPRSAADLLDGSCAVWCDRTQQAVGPDNQIVDYEDCAPGRGCWRGLEDPT